MSVWQWWRKNHIYLSKKLCITDGADFFKLSRISQDIVLLYWKEGIISDRERR